MTVQDRLNYWDKIIIALECAVDWLTEAGEAAYFAGEDFINDDSGSRFETDLQALLDEARRLNAKISEAREKQRQIRVLRRKWRVRRKR